VSNCVVCNVAGRQAFKMLAEIWQFDILHSFCKNRQQVENTISILSHYFNMCLLQSMPGFILQPSCKRSDDVLLSDQCCNIVSRLSKVVRYH
jgi:hypothetical protein